LVEILQVGPARASIDLEDGGRLVALTLDGIELLGAERPKPGEPAGWFYGSFPMAPFAGRLSLGRFDFRGDSYQVPCNWNSHAGHGVAYDVPWRIDGPQTISQLHLRTELDGRWPLGGFARQEFHLSDRSLSMRLQVGNENREMPASAGFHPWFRRRLAGSDDAVLALTPNQRYTTAPDDTRPVLTSDLGHRPWDDVLTGFATPPAISWPGGPKLTLTSNTDTWVVFEQLPDGFCIEPVSAPPDSLGTPQSMVVRPGAPLDLRFTIAWDS